MAIGKYLNGVAAAIWLLATVMFAFITARKYVAGGDAWGSFISLTVCWFWFKEHVENR